MFLKISRSIGSLIAQLVNRRIISIEIFRNLRFKGKLTISGYLENNIFPNNKIYKCQDLLFNIDFTDQIQKYIYLNLYERLETKLLSQYLKPGACCFDIGANVGYYSLHMAKAIGSSGEVFAFEPDPEIFEKLNQNILLNAKQSTIHTYQLALSSETSTTLFSRTLSSNSGWGRIGELNFSQESLEVRTITLDQFVKTNNICKIDLLKCDIEGHEFQFLRGAEQTLGSGIIDLILIEYCGNVLERQGYSVQDYLKIFKSYGYTPTLFNLSQSKKQIRFSVYNLFFMKEI